MDTLYPATVGTVNLAPSTGALSFYRWLYRWHSQTGLVNASTGYLARKQGKTERTVYRWLSELLAAGFIQTEVTSGVERRILPLLPSPGSGRRRVTVQARASAAPSQSEFRCTVNRKQYETVEPVTPDLSGVMSGVLSGVMSGVPIPISDALTQDTTTDNHVAAPRLPEVTGCEQVAAARLPESPVVLALCDAGVTASTAARLVQERGERECLTQLQALPYRKPVDAASVLVASIQGKWSLPGALVRERDKARKEADRLARVQARAIVQAQEQKTRTDALERLSALPAALYASLEASAVALWHREQPAAARLMAGRVGASAVVHRYMVRLLDGEGGGVHA